MKVEIEIVKPNLQVVEDCVYFSLGHPSQFAAAGLVVDEVVRKYIGKLRVPEAMYRASLHGRNAKNDGGYTIPFSDYIEVICGGLQSDTHKAIISRDSKLFNLSILADANTLENPEDRDVWISMKNFLENPEKAFDETEKENFEKGRPIVFDRQ